MKTSLAWILPIALVAAVALPVRGETVELKGGHKIVGEILKSTDQAVVVDLGFTVLRVPHNEIVRIEGAAAAATASAPARELPAKEADLARIAGPVLEPAGPAATAPAERKSPQWQLYRTAELTEGTIEGCAECYAEAVVMISSPGGLGSGFIISPDGYCITNYHVIAQETKIKATVFRKTETGFEQKHYRDVRIIALNPFVDLALLKIDSPSESFKYAYLGRMDELKTGQEVFAIGNPLGLTRTVSSGIVSTTNRNYDGDLYIQTTTDVNPGNSGGPLFNLRGEVIGVTSMGYLFLSGLNFAIPVDVVQRFIINRDAFAYDEDNPNSGYRYHQPAARVSRAGPPKGRLPQ
jgi:serine protease Do